MSLWEQLKWSLRHSARQLLESILVVFVIGLGVGVLVTVLAMFLSMNEEFNKIGRIDYFRTLEIQGKTEAARWGSAPIALLGTDVSDHEWGASLSKIMELQQQLPSSMHVFVENGWAAASSLLPEEGGEDYYFYRGNEVFITGTLPEYFRFHDGVFKAGTYFLTEDVLSGNRVLVLSELLAEELFGAEPAVGRTVPLSVDDGEPLKFTVIGVVGPVSEDDEYSVFSGARMAWAPLTVSPFYRSAGEEANFRRVNVGVDQEVDLAQALGLVQSEASLIWGEGTVIVESNLDFWREATKTMQRQGLLIGLLASVGLFIAIINILNLMLARLLKRTKSIGLNIALGSSRWMVFRQFMMEAVSLGMAGALVGIALSFAFAELLKNSLSLFATAKLGARIGLGVAMGFVVSLLFGVYPAYLGSLINPVEALRNE